MYTVHCTLYRLHGRTQYTGPNTCCNAQFHNCTAYCTGTVYKSHLYMYTVPGTVQLNTEQVYKSHMYRYRIHSVTVTVIPGFCAPHTHTRADWFPRHVLLRCLSGYQIWNLGTLRWGWAMCLSPANKIHETLHSALERENTLCVVNQEQYNYYSIT